MSYENVELADKNGRKFTLRRLNVVEQTRLRRAIGPGQSGNDEYAGIVMLAAAVRTLDGRALPMPTNERQIDAAIERLGDDVFEALGEYAERLQQAEAPATDEEGETADPLDRSGASLTTKDTAAS